MRDKSQFVSVSLESESVPIVIEQRDLHMHVFGNLLKPIFLSSTYVSIGWMYILEYWFLFDFFSSKYLHTIL